MILHRLYCAIIHLFQTLPNTRQTMSSPQTFIFLHGAWQASWCWKRVADPLMAAGHRVITPDLPGHGMRMQPTHTVTFQDYVTAIIELVEQQAEPVTLIGHSMAGLIISQVAEHVPNRIKELVFIAAYIPEDNQSLFSIAEKLESRGVSPLLLIDRVKQEIQLKRCPELMSLFFNRCSTKDAQEAFNQLQPQPLQPFTAKVRVGDSFNRVAKRFFICTDDRVLLPSDQLKMSNKATKHITHLDADHSAYYSNTEDLVSLINQK